MKIAFSSEAFQDFQNWSREDKKTFSKSVPSLRILNLHPSMVSANRNP